MANIYHYFYQKNKCTFAEYFSDAIPPRVGEIIDLSNVPDVVLEERGYLVIEVIRQPTQFLPDFGLEVPSSVIENVFIEVILNNKPLS
jgi:hypothetical protein